MINDECLCTYNPETWEWKANHIRKESVAVNHEVNRFVYNCQSNIFFVNCSNNHNRHLTLGPLFIACIILPICFFIPTLPLQFCVFFHQLNDSCKGLVAKPLVVLARSRAYGPVLSVCPSVRKHDNSLQTQRIDLKLSIYLFEAKSGAKFEDGQNRTKKFSCHWYLIETNVGSMGQIKILSEWAEI
jgi:hypothetical protein